jgi:dCMP deaminase
VDKWDHRFMEMAHLVSNWTSCINEGRSIGAVIVKDKRVMTTGYNGAAAGTRAEVCYAIHAEQNAVIQAAKLGLAIDSATLYCTHQPCSVCAKILVNAGIRRIVYKHGYPDDFALEVLNEAGVILERFEDIPQ